MGVIWGLAQRFLIKKKETSIKKSISWGKKVRQKNVEKKKGRREKEEGKNIKINEKTHF